MSTAPRDARSRAPLDDAIIIAVAELVNDAQTERRDPSHSDITHLVDRAGLGRGDPAQNGQTVGKAKRVRAILSWALELAPDQGELFVASLIDMVRARGGFRQGSSNFVGQEPIVEAINAFRAQGFVLTAEGELRPATLDTLVGKP
jgi:hypothetical protein